MLELANSNELQSLGFMCCVVMMKLVIWAQEEVFSLHFLFLNSKFMFSWRLQLTTLSPCLFCVFCLAFVVASYNLGACNCHDCACNRACVCVCVFFWSFVFVNMASYVSPLWKLILGHLFFHMLQHLAIVLQL